MPQGQCILGGIYREDTMLYTGRTHAHITNTQATRKTGQELREMITPRTITWYHVTILHLCHPLSDDFHDRALCSPVELVELFLDIPLQIPVHLFGRDI